MPPQALNNNSNPERKPAETGQQVASGKDLSRFDRIKAGMKSFVSPPQIRSGIITAIGAGLMAASGGAMASKSQVAADVIKPASISAPAATTKASIPANFERAKSVEFQPKTADELTAVALMLDKKPMTHIKIDNKRIFNDPKILDAVYQKNQLTYYEPADPQNSPYRLAFMKERAKGQINSDENYKKALEVEGYQLVEAASDFVVNAEIENGEAGNNHSFYANGLAVIKKGTKMLKKDTGNKAANGKIIYNSWIASCFNPVYALACITKDKK